MSGESQVRLKPVEATPLFPLAPPLPPVQGFHLGQVPEGPVGQLADAVPLQLEDLQAGQTLEGQTLHLTDAVPVQLPAKETERKKRKEKGKKKKHEKEAEKKGRDAQSHFKVSNCVPAWWSGQ